MIEVAQALNLTKKRHCGLKFVTKHFGPDRVHSANKSRGRSQVSGRYRSKAWPGALSILTMPSLKFCFERALLAARIERPYASELDFDPHALSPRQYKEWLATFPMLPTKVTCCESNEAIFRASLAHMPGAKESLRILDPHLCATDQITGYYCKDILDVMQDETLSFDAAWLDFCGYISFKRFNIIKEFFDKRVTTEITLTSERARFDNKTKEAFSEFGSYEAWLGSLGNVDRVYKYNDGTPFIQLTITKASVAHQEEPMIRTHKNAVRGRALAPDLSRYSLVAE